MLRPTEAVMKIQPIPKEPPYEQVKLGYFDNP
jgi:hypothetical protein